MEDQLSGDFFAIAATDLFNDMDKMVHTLVTDVGVPQSSCHLSVVAPLLNEELGFVVRRGCCGTKQWNRLVQRISDAYQTLEYNEWGKDYEEWMDEKS